MSTNTSLEQIKQSMLKAQDSVHASKLQTLIDKVETDQLYITFCGHFSAGKSSLINHLCGHKLLPSSPIPTSSNVVSIRNGAEQVLVKGWKDSNKEQIQLEQLQEYCVNNTDIETVEIHYPVPFLANSIALLDTPGIDSTDDAHYLSTDSALHLADCVFYVMDYNHVQSEVNFNFAKRLQDMGKPLYLIVNQIDKHNDTELPFEEYRDGVKQAFENWHIKPQGILFISLKDRDHVFNELSQIEPCIQALSKASNELRWMNVHHATKQLIKDHVQAISVNRLTDEQYDKAVIRHQELENRLTSIKEAAMQYDSKLKKEIKSLLDNANIIPALTRDLAQQYLQSCKPGFKVGLFFTENKTVEEKNKRLLRFQHNFEEQINIHLAGHLQDLLRKRAEESGALTEHLLQNISRIKVEITSDWLQRRVQNSSNYSDEYTMNYAKQIASDVKELYRQQTNDIIEPIMLAFQGDSKDKAIVIEEEMNELWSNIEEYQVEDSLVGMMDWEYKSINLPQIIWKQREKETKNPSIEKKDHIELPLTTMDAKENTALNRFSKDKLRGRLLKSSEQLRQAYAIIEPLSSMQSMVTDMMDKANRLEESRFTIALFGAFSAGKSSFANSLLGTRILPVSPNPTTAAINRISAPIEGHPHGTATIVMKEHDKLWEEIQYSLERIGHKASSIKEALDKIRTLQPDQISGKGKPHYAFLRAVEQGWLDAKLQLGQMLQVDLEQFRAYAANEAQSCFVETIELYYSSPFTEAGFILVDTPGADSINARHTDVAFNYIKNADLILFVTYFNHAFSKADREFLLQLGRVKDSFEMDKMFFIINAADLASSSEELQEVIQHLDVNLAAYGIRNPQIHPISSLKAIEGKEQRDQSLIQQSGITAFETDFISFTSTELMDLAVQSANQEVNRAIHVLEQRVKAAQEDDTQRTQQAEAIRHAYTELQTTLKGLDFSEEEKALSKEINELLYYVKQRVLYRFGDLFNLAFNPSDLRVDQNHKKADVVEAYEELLRSVSFHCSQEVLAATLRIENFMNRLARKQFEQMNQRIYAEIKIVEPIPYEGKSFITAQVENHIEGALADNKWLINQFKNAKYFFEGEGKAKLKEQLELKWFDPIDKYVEKHMELLFTHYRFELINWMNHLNKKQADLLIENVEGYLQALEKKFPVEEIMECQSRLKQLLVYT